MPSMDVSMQCSQCSLQSMAVNVSLLCTFGILLSNTLNHTISHWPVVAVMFAAYDHHLVKQGMVVIVY